MTDAISVRPQSRGRRKFANGARVKGKDEGTASFRGRTGTVVGYVGWSRQYKVEFDDGRVEFPYVHEIEAA